jgi:Putative adhesin
MTNWDFPCTDPVDISIDSWGSGSIAVSGEPTSRISVEVLPSGRSADADDLLGEVQVSFEDGQLYVHGPRAASFRRKRGLDLTIMAPSGSSCAARTASADVACVGELSGLSVHTASGDVTAAAITGDVTIQSASGDALLNEVGGDLAVTTASGDVQATRVDGDTRVNTASGDVAIGYCAGSVSAHTASGDLELRCVASGDVQLMSASGDMQVGVVPGIGVYLDLASTSGSVRSELDASDGDISAATVQLKCRTLSGDIRIFKARGEQARPGKDLAPQQAAEPEPTGTDAEGDAPDQPAAQQD